MQILFWSFPLSSHWIISHFTPFIMHRTSVGFREHAFTRMLHGTIRHIVFRCFSLESFSSPSRSLPSNRLCDRANCFVCCVGTRITDAAPIVTLEFTHSCKLQQLYKNNDTLIPAPLFTPACASYYRSIRCHRFEKIFTSIRSSPSSNLKKGGPTRSDW